MEAVHADLLEAQLPLGVVVRLAAAGCRGRATVEELSPGLLVLRVFDGLVAYSIGSRLADRVLWLAPPPAMTRIQRREFYRVGVTLPVGIITDHRTGTVLGRTVDVSAGGIALELDQSDLELDEIGEVWLRVPEGPPVRATAVVVGVGEVYRLRFSGITFAERERLARFTLRFDAARRRRRPGRVR
jgi:hypothetical protein